MLCDPNGPSISHYTLLIITSSSFVVDFHYLLPIVVVNITSAVDVDPKGKKLVDEDVVVIIESLQFIAKLPTLKTQVSKKKNYNFTQKFQESCVAKLPWLKCVWGLNGCLYIVKCKIYSQIEGKNKLLAFKWDLLCKHVGHTKAQKDMASMKTWE